MANNNEPKSVSTPKNKKQKVTQQSKESKLQKLVKSNPHFEFLQNGKIKCTLTGHQFLPTVENYDKYLTSKSYIKGLESQFDISQYEEYLVPHKVNKKFLFCKLTGVRIPSRKSAIDRHVHSRKFKYRLQEILEEQSQNGQKDIIQEQKQEYEQEKE